MASLKDLSFRVKQFFSNAGSNLNAWKQVATQPQLRQGYSNYVVKPTVQNWQAKPSNQLVKQGVSNLTQNVKYLSNPETAYQWESGFKNNIPGQIGRAFTYNYISPALQTPYRARQFVSGVKNKNLGDVAQGGLGAVSGVFSTLTPGISDLGFGLYNFTKGWNKEYRENPKATVRGQTRSGLRAITGETPVGLGEALSTNERTQNILNIAELPLMVFAGRMGKNTPVFSKDQLKLAKQEFSDPQTRSLVGQFAELVETNPNINRKNLGSLGEYVQALGEELFGKAGSDLTNKQLKNAFDLIFQKASTLKEPLPIFKRIKLGLTTEDVRKDQSPTVGVGVRTPMGNIPQTGKKSIEGIESLGQKLPTEITQPELSLLKPKAPSISLEKSISQPEPLPWEVPGYKSRELPKIEIPTQKAELQGGATRAALGIHENLYADWVNARRATTIEGLIKKKKFTDLDSKGINGIFEFQAGNKTGRYANVKDYFDQKFETIKDYWNETNYKKDYLPQLWDNTPEEIEKVFGRRLGGKNPSFVIDSVIKNYQEGIDFGLKPKFSTISQLIGWYERVANKAIADKNFFTALIKDGLISTSGKAPNDWVTLNPDRFPKIKFKTDNFEYSGTYKAPPDLAKMVNNYLAEPNANLQKVADFASSTKNRLLSFGIPGTAFNAHGFNILARSFMQSPIKGTYTALKYMINPGSAQRYLDTNLKNAPDAIRKGLTFSTSEYNSLFEQPSKGLVSNFGQIWNGLFEKPLFDQMLPALKLEKYYDIFNAYKKTMSRDEAAREAAKFVNNLFGGFNWEQLGKSKDWQNLLRSVILAPDWFGSNIRLAKEIGKSFIKISDPKLAAYRRFAATFLGSFLTANAINKMLSGHFMYKNDSGHTFEIDTGTYTEDGQKRYVKVFGTAADFVRLPIDIAMGLKNGDPSVVGRIIRNRFSTLLQPMTTLITNTDYLGNPVFGKTKYGQPMTLKQNLAGAYATLAPAVGFPSFLQSGVDVATGKRGLEQGILQGLELPIRYSGGTYSTAQKQGKEITGVARKELYEQNKLLKGQTKFGTKQEEELKAGVIKISDVLRERKAMTTENKIRDKVRESGQPETTKESYFYMDDNGSVKKIDLNPKTPKLDLTGQVSLDKKLISAYKSEITSQQSDIRKLYELGQLSAEEAEVKIDELEALKNVVGKKPKKAKKITIKKITVPKVTVSSPKVSNIKISKPPKPKKITINKNKLKTKKVVYRIKKPKKVTVAISKKGSII